MNEVTIPDALYNEVIDYLAEELFGTWHPKIPDGCRLPLDPNYKRNKTIDHYCKYRGGVDVLSIIARAMIHDIQADAWALARRYEEDREIC